MKTKYNDLLLSVDLKSWQITSTSHSTLAEKPADEAKLNTYRRVMERDDHTCFYCGFRSDKFQEVHHLNDDHDDNTENNLVTVCPLCHQSHHLNAASINNGATLIWLPELTQQELNHLCRVMFIAEQIKDDSGGSSKNFIVDNAYSWIYGDLMETRKRTLEEKFGTGSSDLGIFAQILLDIKTENPKQYRARADWIRSFKLLHKPARFYLQTQYWKENVINMPVYRWVSLANKIENKPELEELKSIVDAPLLD